MTEEGATTATVTTETPDVSAPSVVAQPESPWYSEDYKDVVETKGWKDPNEALESYIELEKAMGGRTKIPDENSSEEEVSAFYEKLGRPENPEGYDIPHEEGGVYDEEFESAMKAAAHKANMPKGMFENLVNEYFQYLQDDLARKTQEGINALKDEWKANYDTEVKIAQRFTEQCSDEFKNLLVTTGLGSNPVFVKEFNALGKKILDDTLVTGSQAKEDEYMPAYPDSPQMYENMEGEDGKKARAWHRARGHVYNRKD